MSLYPLLHQYLVEYSNLHLPGVGTLYFASTPAKLDVADKKLSSPKKSIELDSSATEWDKHTLLGFLGQQLHITEEQAFGLLQRFTGHIKTVLKENGTVNWNDLGSFQQDETGHISFDQSCGAENYYQPVVAERIVRQNAQHAMTVGDTETTNTAMHEYYGESEKTIKDYWWVFAIVIFVVSAVLIGLKYFG